MRPVAGFIFFALLMLSAEICSAEIQFEGEFRSLLYLQNDRDFDKTPSVFDPQGQWLGLAGSFVSGRFQYAVDAETRLVYSGLLGWNTWGRHDVNQPTPFSPANNAPVLYRHRMLYADWHQDQVGLSVGYQHVVDPSQLIVDQFMPGLQLRFQSGEFKYRGLWDNYRRQPLRAGMLARTTSRKTASCGQVRDLGRGHLRRSNWVFLVYQIPVSSIGRSSCILVSWAFPLVSVDSQQKLILSVKLVGGTMALLMEETRTFWHMRVGLSSVMDLVSGAAKPRSVLEPPIFRQKKVAKVMVGRQHFGGPVSCPVRQYGSQKMSDKTGTITLMKDGPGVEARF